MNSFANVHQAHVALAKKFSQMYRVRTVRWRVQSWGYRNEEKRSLQQTFEDVYAAHCPYNAGRDLFAYENKM